MRGVFLWTIAGLLVLDSGATATQATDELFAAARSGDVDAVAAQLDAGVAVDAIDKYGATALAMAAGEGHIEVLRLLLDRGADVDHAEDFYGARPLDLALFFRGELEAAKLLLEHGAEGRENAFGFAIQREDLGLAKAAASGGPFYASQLEALKKNASELDQGFQELVESLQRRPDPAPPEYGIEELHAFTGRFEGWTSDTAIEIALRERALLMWLDGEARGELELVGDRLFRTADGIGVAFNGRAGTIEGIVLRRESAPPELSRRSVAEPDPEAVARFAALATGASSRTTVHWPRFRGANAEGIGDGVDTPTNWNLESGEGVLWQLEIEGLANSSPVVWGDRVLVTTAVARDVEQKITTGLTGAGDGVDEEVEHSWRVLAFDKWSGEKLWDTEIGRGVPLTKRHFKATQANSTPATDGEHVVVVFPTAGLACLDMNGKVMWHHDLGGLNAGAFTDPGIEWGFASSPIIHDDKAILQVDIHGGQYLAAWDLETGEELWRTERDVAPSWATPTVMEGPEGLELVVNGSTIHSYDPETGAELWSLGPNSELVVATPVVSDGVAYVSAGYPPVKPIYAVKAGRRGDFTVTPGEPDENLLWSQRIGGAYMPTPLLYRGLFYVVHHNGRIVGYDPGDGSPVFKSRFSKGGAFTGSPVAANGTLYIPTEEGLLYLLEAGPEYKEIAVHDFGEPLMTTPAISEGLLIVRTTSKVMALGKAKG